MRFIILLTLIITSNSYVWSNATLDGPLNYMCNYQLSNAMQSLFQESIKSDESPISNLDKIIRTRSQLALERSALTFYELRGDDYKDAKHASKRLKEQIDKKIKANSNKYSAKELEQYLEFIASDERKTDYVYDKQIGELELFLKAPSKVIFEKEPKYQVTDVDLFFLNKATLAYRRKKGGANSLLNYTVDQIKQHMPERSFDDDEKVIKAKVVNNLSQFKAEISRALTELLPKAIDRIKQTCPAVVEELNGDPNLKCQLIDTFIEKDLEDYEKILKVIEEKLIIKKENPIFLGVAGPIANIKCSFYKNEDNTIGLNFEPSLRNFEGITRPIWSLKTSLENDSVTKLQNRDAKNEYKQEKNFLFENATQLQESSIRFEHNERIYARPSISINGSTPAKRTKEVDLSQCENYEAMLDKMPVTTEVEKDKKQDDKTPAKKKDTAKKKSDYFEVKFDTEEEPTQTHITMTIKNKAKTCSYSECSPKQMKKEKEKKSCSYEDQGKKGKNTFNKKDEEYRVYVYCKDKNDKKSKYSAYKNRAGKVKSIKIKACEKGACSSQDFSLPYIPPQMEDLQRPQPNFIDVPLLLEM